jgi:glycosyltransferase 2 family protein
MTEGLVSTRRSDCGAVGLTRVGRIAAEGLASTLRCGGRHQRDGRFTTQMGVRERMHRLAAASAAFATDRRVRLVSQLLLAVGVVFVLARLGSIWRESNVDLGRVGWGWIGAALALTTCGVLAGGFIWLAILRQLGSRTSPRLVAVYFQAQLAKYIPGTVWQYAGRAALARTRGIPLRTVSLSVPAELGACAVAAGLVSTLLLGTFPALGACLVLLVLILDGRRRDGTLARILARLGRSDVVLGLQAALIAIPMYVAAWLAIGSGFWLTARGLVNVPVAEVGTYSGAFCVAWLVGLFAVFAPGGLGVREAVIVALLRGRIGSADAVVIAAASRSILTLIDLCAAGGSVFLLRRNGGLQPEETSTADCSGVVLRRASEAAQSGE